MQGLGLPGEFMLKVSLFTGIWVLLASSAQGPVVQCMMKELNVHVDWPVNYLLGAVLHILQQD